MFQRDAYALIALALAGVVFTLYAVIGSTPFFPRSLQLQSGICPASDDYPAERRRVMDASEAEWYSSGLFSLHEQPLFPDRDRPLQTVRFTLLRSFHAPLTVRTTDLKDGRLRLQATLAPGPDGCPEDKDDCRIDRVLTQTEQARVARAQSLLETDTYGCATGIDGSMWLVEASWRGDYRFWSEWSPRHGELRDLALVMIDLTGWELKEID